MFESPDKGRKRRMTRTTLGVIGTGRIGRMHTENTTDFAELLQDPEIEGVVIALSSELHAETICRAAEAGKHIFCEKPVGFAPEPIAEALAAVRKAGVQLQVGFNRRFDPSLQKLQQAVRDGAVGDLHSVRVINRDPKAPDLDRSGGMFFDFTIHDFDTLRFLGESEIEEVYAAGAALVDEEIAAAGDIDTALVMVRLATATTSGSRPLARRGISQQGISGRHR
jgi:myo-inositol 2-dehydrogenase/D-chiro-inositol 1-dehydrogenase